MAKKGRTREVGDSLKPGVSLRSAPGPTLPPAPRVLKEVMTDRIEIYDTTLRDGSQGEGVNFSVEDKCRVAEQLDAFGVDFIEGGWPGSNPRDLAFFERARKLRL